jgi:hypothetical protein
MKRYMIVETRDPLEADANWSAELAAALKRNGADASILLADNGVFAARAGAHAVALAAAIKSGCTIMADRYALRERGIRESDLMRGVSAIELDAVVDALEAGANVMWR